MCGVGSRLYSKSAKAIFLVLAPWVLIVMSFAPLFYRTKQEGNTEEMERLAQLLAETRTMLDAERAETGRLRALVEEKNAVCMKCAASIGRVGMF